MPPVQTLILKRKLTEQQGNDLCAKFLTEKDIDMVIDFDADVWSAEGELLLKFRKGVIPMPILMAGYNAFEPAIKQTLMRGIASGGKKLYINKDGKESKTSVGSPVESSIVGYMDSLPKMPYCRKTAFTKDYFETFQAGLPFVQQVDRLYKELCPDHYKRQIAIANGTNINFRIGDTSFTTVTVNRNFRTAVHKDSGDFRPGFGNLCVYRSGYYEGAYFCLPEFGVGVDMQNQDMLFVDVHKWHGNTDFVNASPDYNRVSFVMYYREYMINCGSPSQELAKVKKDRGGFLKL